jgi:hypothetical protein
VPERFLAQLSRETAVSQVAREPLAGIHGADRLSIEPEPLEPKPQVP